MIFSKFHKLLFILLLSLSSYASSHNLAPALLEITMENSSTANVRWKTTNKQMSGVDLMPVFSDLCQPLTKTKVSLEGRAVIYQWKIQCKEKLIGQSVSFKDLGRSGINVMVVFTQENGRQESRLLYDGEATFIMPDRISPIDTMKQYFLSGIEHLVFGWDHVLFVFGLLFLLHKKLSVLILAVTSFTIGHSFSLIMASLGLLFFNVQLIEIFIAVTLIVMALEILSIHHPAYPFSIRRQPYVITLIFGLIHGCGFAAVLSDALSQEGKIITPLLSFNIGIEVGQILIIGIILCLFALLTKAGNSIKVENYSSLVGYPIGIMSTYWLIERSFS